ncbi:hypothetical protein ElyMa_003645700 [Elysia marginata]|uniref:Uncharacterized protein n=1 Tax=Elysia marginata TaxID=1093978 RepID=A0AAV4EWE2_9GAST|nr:hypothetical protein ElyMa_003645700 [Elysia marginata]
MYLPLQVKTTLRTAPRDVAIECFEVALLFLTQAFPNVSVTETSSSFEKHEDKMFKENFKRQSQRMNDVEEKLEELEDVSTTIKDKQTKTQNKVKLLSGKLCDRRKKLQDDLSEKLNDVQENIQKKIESDLSKRSSFSVKAVSDVRAPGILDLKLLPGGLVLVVDYSNSCVKLFNTQGRFIDSQTLDENPWRIAVLNPTSTCDWDVAVTLLDKCQIALLKVTQQRISCKVRKFIMKKLGVPF